MRKTLLLIAACCLQGMTIAQEPVYRQASAPIEERVSDLLGRMTLEEKIGQICCPLGWEMYTKVSPDSVTISDKYRQHRFLLGCSPCRSVDSENSGNRTESPAGSQGSECLTEVCGRAYPPGNSCPFCRRMSAWSHGYRSNSIPYFHGTGLNME